MRTGTTCAARTSTSAEQVTSGLPPAGAGAELVRGSRTALRAGRLGDGAAGARLGRLARAVRACAARRVRSWQEWSTGQQEQAARRFEAVAEQGLLDVRYFYGTIIAYNLIGDLEGSRRAAAHLTEANTGLDARAAYCQAIALPYHYNAAHDYDDAFVWVQRALEIASEAGSPSAVAHALHIRALTRHRTDTPPPVGTPVERSSWRPGSPQAT